MTRPAIHPGQHIADELEALDMSASTLARELGIPSNRITGIIRGRRGITADTQSGSASGPEHRWSSG